MLKKRKKKKVKKSSSFDFLKLHKKITTNIKNGLSEGVLFFTCQIPISINDLRSCEFF